jgi:hypothetical protein
MVQKFFGKSGSFAANIGVAPSTEYNIFFALSVITEFKIKTLLKKS